MLKHILIFVFAGFILHSCQNAQRNDANPDFASSISIVDVYKELQNIKSADEWKSFYEAHPEFSKLYFENILSLDTTQGSTGLYKNWQQASRDSGFIALEDKVLKVFPNTDFMKRDFEKLFKEMQTHFPEIKMPTFYTLISDFTYQVFIFEDKNKQDGVGISLDMFLGDAIDYKMVAPDNTNFSNYFTRSWNKDHITRKVANLYIDEFVGPPSGYKMLDIMLNHGKSLYIAEKFLPEANDTIIMEFSESQLDWCKNNELPMWSFFLDNNLFYESSQSKIGKYINPSPNSPGMPTEAPGRTGDYIGWQIIRAYMKRYPETSLSDLIKMNDSQMILEKSKYKPKQK